MSADWTAIQREYEQGISQHSLAAKYDISQQAISKKALKEGWVVTPVVIPLETVVSDNLVDQALADLAIHLTDDPAKAKLQLNQHKLFADSFSQYMKAKALFPVEQENRDGFFIPYDDISAWARMEIQRILAEDKRRRERVS